MNRNELIELHYISHIDNLRSIPAGGILSHKRVLRLKHKSVAMTEIQERREKVIIPGARPLHDYVNIYFNARNKMMYKIVCNKDVFDICVLRIDTAVLGLPSVIIADRNASSDYVTFRPSPRGLDIIDKDLVFAQYWNHPEDPIETMRHGSIACAEVLVPDSVKPEYIIGAYSANEQGKEKVLGIAPDFDVIIKPNLFFR